MPVPRLELKESQTPPSVLDAIGIPDQHFFLLFDISHGLLDIQVEADPTNTTLMELLKLVICRLSIDDCDSTSVLFTEL